MEGKLVSFVTCTTDKYHDGFNFSNTSLPSIGETQTWGSNDRVEGFWPTFGQTGQSKR